MQAMSMSIAPVSASPPTGGKQIRPTTDVGGAQSRAPLTNGGETRSAAKQPDKHTNNEISFDDAGFTVVRTVDIVTGDVVGQNPTEAYLRLAHAMIDALRSERDGERTADLRV